MFLHVFFWYFPAVLCGCFVRPGRGWTTAFEHKKTASEGTCSPIGDGLRLWRWMYGNGDGDTETARMIQTVRMIRWNGRSVRTVEIIFVPFAKIAVGTEGAQIAHVGCPAFGDGDDMVHMKNHAVLSSSAAEHTAESVALHDIISNGWGDFGSFLRNPGGRRSSESALSAVSGNEAQKKNEGCGHEGNKGNMNDAACSIRLQILIVSGHDDQENRNGHDESQEGRQRRDADDVDVSSVAL